MKLRVIATLVAVLAFGVGSASAQSIGIFADTGSSSCNIQIPIYSQTSSFYINVVGAGSLVPTGINGAEFKVIHNFTGADGILTVIPNAASNVALGDPMAGGCNIAFPGCQNGPSINLYEIKVFLLNAAYTDFVSIGAHDAPSNENFACSLINKCDAPIFTAVCVPGGAAYINDTADPCQIAVEEKSWGEVKSLFN